MPYRYVEPEVFLEHGGVTVFFTYSDNCPCSYWFTTQPESADDDGASSHFDARMFVGKWSQTPTVAQWEEWWRPRFRQEDEAVEALVRTAIDDGKVKQPT